MKKTKIEQRIENAVNAFFDDGNLTENNSLVYSNDVSLLQSDTLKVFTEKADVFVKFLKQVFLFFPGTFVLFNLSLFFTTVTLNPATAQWAYPNRLVFALLTSAFMTMFGLGNIKNIKHLIIPASVVLFAFISGVIISCSSNSLKILDNYAIYLFPLALIIPFLAKSWVDKTDKNFDGV
ncbi:MAG: hypothetical protein ACR2N3_00055 [Pyrinomonadaceae bacterium]